MKYKREKFRYLGKQNDLLSNPNKSILDKHPNPHLDAKYCIRFTCPEFTSICPVTSQPDFANVYIYSDKQISIKWVREYLMSYQDQGDFHEQCIEAIFNDVNDEYNCEHLEVCGRFQRRGGIDINPIRGNKKNILFKNFREFNQ